MSDDVFGNLGDDDIFEEEEQKPKTAAGDGQNRTFIIAVAVLGGLLVCALISFGVWALVLNRPQEANTRIGEALEAPAAEVVVDAAADTLAATPEPPEPTDTPAPTETPVPTDTPEPTPTPLLGPTATSIPEDAEGEGEAGAATETEAAEGGDTETASAVAAAEVTPTATQAPRRTPTPTRTPAATETPRAPSADSNLGASSGQLSQTGMGEWLLIGAAAVLIAVMMAARKLRKT